MAPTNGRPHPRRVSSRTRLLDQSPFAGFQDPILLNQLTRQVQNTSSIRKLWDRSGGASDPDPRRSFEDEFGWPTAPSPELYKKLYDYDSLAARIVEYPVRECWQLPPSVFETKDEKTVTPFERWLDKDLPGMLRGGTSRYKPDDKGHPLWWYCQLVDALSRQGSYGALFYGLDDGLDPDQPAPGMEEVGTLPMEIKRNEGKKPEFEKLYTHNKGDRYPVYGLTTNAGKAPSRKVNFLRAYPEAQAIVTRWENNPQSPRYCKPVMYQIRVLDPNASYSGLGLPMSTINVHWTRIVHVADIHHHACSSEDLAIPANQSVLYDILDGRKVSGSSAEGYWQTAIYKLFLSTHPQLGGDVEIDEDPLKDMLEEMRNSSQREGVLRGMTPMPVAPTVPDPTPYYDLKLKRVSTRTGVPKRILEGSERGELSSGQDEDTNSDRIAERQNTYLSPRLVSPVIDRFVDLGIAPAPEEYTISWPPTGTQNKLEQAQIFSTRMTGFAAYTSGGVDRLIPEREMLIHEAGYDEETADAILEASVVAQEEKDAEAATHADEHGFEPAPMPGFKQPDPDPEPPQPVKLREGEKLVHPAPPPE